MKNYKDSNVSVTRQKDFLKFLKSIEKNTCSNESQSKVNFKKKFIRSLPITKLKKKKN